MTFFITVFRAHDFTVIIFDGCDLFSVFKNYFWVHLSFTVNELCSAMECAVHQTKIQSIYWDCTWVVATITLEVPMQVQRGFCSPTPLKELMVPWSGICIPKVQEIPIKTGEMWWKMVKTVKKHTITVLGVVLSRNWLKQYGFFCRVVIIWKGMMQNDVQMVWMPKDWEKYWKVK